MWLISIRLGEVAAGGFKTYKAVSWRSFQYFGQCWEDQDRGNISQCSIPVRIVDCVPDHSAHARLSIPRPSNSATIQMVVTENTLEGVSGELDKRHCGKVLSGEQKYDVKAARPSAMESSLSTHG